jgi:hypothetical protein
VGLSSLRLLTMYFLSQAPPLAGLHRGSRVPFRGSFFTAGLHPPVAMPQGLIAYWYKRRCFPHIPSPRFSWRTLTAASGQPPRRACPSSHDVRSVETMEQRPQSVFNKMLF